MRGPAEFLVLSSSGRRRSCSASPASASPMRSAISTTLALDQAHAVAAQLQSQRRIGRGGQLPESGDGLGGVAGLMPVARRYCRPERADARGVRGDLDVRPTPTGRGEEFGAEGSRLDDGHVDAQRRQLGVERFGDRLEGRLGRAVEASARAGDEPGARADVDDAACARSTGSAARVTLSTPNTLVSNSARAWASEISSIAPRSPYPALLTSTSIRPNRSTAAGDRRVGLLGHRDVQRYRHSACACVRERFDHPPRVAGAAATWSPWARADAVSARPSPRQAPVTNQTDMLSCQLFRCAGRCHRR